MKRAREQTDDGGQGGKKRRLLPTKQYLRERLRRVGLPVSGTKRTLMRRLELHKMTKGELQGIVLDLTPGVQIPRGVLKKDLVTLVPKIEKASEKTVDELKAKLQRMHHFVHVMPSDGALKKEWIKAYAEALIYKCVGLHAESDEESEIDMLLTKRELLYELNNIDSKNIHFSPKMSKPELVAAFQKYILDINTMTKNEIREKLKAEFPEHLPMTNVKKRDHCIILAHCLFQQEYGGTAIDDPKTHTVDQMKAALKDAGITAPPGVFRPDLEALYNVFVYKQAGHMRKRDIRDFLNGEGVEHTLTDSRKKSEHIEAFENYFKKKYVKTQT